MRLRLRSCWKGIEVNLGVFSTSGGTLLNEGCIPTKALRRAAEVYEDIRRAGEFGVSMPDGFNPGSDMKKAVERKDAVVDQLRGGIEFLMQVTS